ncbi:endolytic transglycosylase MltG [Actinomyces sp. B33]|uniref:endolytic transglycosylase MltG n=1 Tax=Actinomyces sp. B33 TaxID=2942131 RepID=UPI002340D725|nr:endolytic transglycosylase MltG [Actinomyces sp. B33]MDC4233248.1 endolytic transglycosylase MltG [Actinomyces sp. B33]
MRARRLAHERRRARKRRFWKRVRAFIVLLLVLGLVGSAAWFAWTQLTGDQTQSAQSSDDYPGPGVDPVDVTIEQGQSGADMGQILVDAGVVKSVDAFIRAFQANKAASSIRPGTYTLKTQMSASQAVAALLDEANRSDNTVTVVPGQTAEQVADRIAQVTGISAADIAAAMADTASLGLPEEAGGVLEGWLAPGSYEVGSADTPTSLLSQMVAGTVAELDRLGVAAADRQTVLIKASILEREVNIDEYLPMVARVIENRLTKPDAETRGLLNMDSSVLYGVGKTGGVPTVDDTEDDNPYNSYLYPGLPPTPIAQPSVEAIEAVLHPADGEWLYYVTIDLDTGETLFATTLSEQEANVQKFRDYCSANPGKC